MKRAYFSMFLVTILVMSGFMVYGETVEEKYVSLKFPDIVTVESGEYITVEFNDYFPQFMSPTNPLLPYTSKVMTFPFGTKIRDVEVTVQELETISLENKILPTPHPVPLTNTPPAFLRPLLFPAGAAIRHNLYTVTAAAEAPGPGTTL